MEPGPTPVKVNGKILIDFKGEGSKPVVSRDGQNDLEYL